MSDFRNNETVRNDSGWAWIGGVVIIVAVVAAIFAFGHRANNGTNSRVANNTSPTVTHMAPPIGAPATPAPKNAPHP